MTTWKEMEHWYSHPFEATYDGLPSTLYDTWEDFMPASIQQVKKVTIPASGTVAIALEANMPTDRLTVWAVSGPTRKVSMTFQPRVNGQAFGALITVAGAVAANVLYSSGGATKEDLIIPQPNAPALSTPPGQVPDPFVFDIFITNTDGANPGTVTLYFCGYNHTGA